MRREFWVVRPEYEELGLRVRVFDEAVRIERVDERGNVLFSIDIGMDEVLLLATRLKQALKELL